MSNIRTGLEALMAAGHPWADTGRLGLLANPASVDRRFRHARDLIHSRCGGKLTALFSPQHGFFAEKQDNMVESDDMTDPVLGVPVFSLYGKVRKPTRKMFEKTDTLIVDIQDVGTRVYTFIYTLSYCMERAAETGTRILILDRPNPIGGVETEGNRLRPDVTSFVGRYPIPMRHGLTVGEFARYINQRFDIGCALDVVPLEGWNRDMHFPETGLPWVAPSPNLPTWQSALVYPGQVIWEGTNVSEGRGTTQPFEIFGAPYIDPDSLKEAAGLSDIPGAIFRPVAFEPTSNKWAGQLCRGFQVHVTDRNIFRPYRTTLKLLEAVCRLFEESFQWKTEAYEYEFDRLAIDLILGDADLRREIEKGADVDTLAAGWDVDLGEYRKEIEPFLLY